MPRINLTIEEHEAIRPVLEAHRMAQSLKAERIRTLLAVRQYFECYHEAESWTTEKVLNILSEVESSL